jgi:CheY-like chemotaxis protein
MNPLILIVDDRREDVDLTQIALSMLGFELQMHSVSTGEKALDFLGTAEQLPALILLDLKMPGMGGLETLKRIRADDRLKNIPVVIVTCSTLESDLEKARAAGVSGFIYKAIRMEEFSKNLARSIEGLIAR